MNVNLPEEMLRRWDWPLSREEEMTLEDVHMPQRNEEASNHFSKNAKHTSMSHKRSSNTYPPMLSSHLRLDPTAAQPRSHHWHALPSAALYTNRSTGKVNCVINVD